MNINPASSAEINAGKLTRAVVAVLVALALSALAALPLAAAPLIAASTLTTLVLVLIWHCLMLLHSPKPENLQVSSGFPAEQSELRVGEFKRFRSETWKTRQGSYWWSDCAMPMRLKALEILNAGEQPGDYPEVQKRVQQHLGETERQMSRLEERLHLNRETLMAPRTD